MCLLCPNLSKDLFCVDCLKQADRKAAIEMQLNADELRNELCQGLFVACDGGSLDNQSETNRYGYGSFRVFKNGNLEFSTYQNKQLLTHNFDYGYGVTSPVAEYQTFIHALTYIDELIARGFTGTIRLGCDHQNAIRAATKGIKKPKPHMREMATKIRELALRHKGQVQFVKIAEQDMKGLLGH